VHRDPRHAVKLAASLTAVYLIWGSSFLFSKIGVTHLPAALFSGVRFILAGLVLSTLAKLWRGDAWPATVRDWRHLFVMSVFMVMGSAGLNVWAMQFISSGESALLNTTAAFWIAGFGSIGARGHPLSRFAVVGLVLGALGTGLTLSPHFSLHSTSALPYLAAITACLSWSIGTMYYRNIDTKIGSMMFIGMQMLIGGILQFALGCALGQLGRWSFGLPGLISLAYLTIFSSCLAYTAYGWLTRNATPAIIGTYSYVNPAIAAFLGWWLLNEGLLPVQFAGMFITIVGVALVTFVGTTPRHDKGLEEPSSP
jgi:drug/metabolite transporter (DMT)-like permease